MPEPEPFSRRIAVVVNGNAKSVTDEIIATLGDILAGGDLFVSRRVEEAKDIARTIATRGYGTVLTGGGDGTFTVMVTEVARACDAEGVPRPRFGLLKLGTGNSLAWVIGASAAKNGRGLAADIQRLRRDAGSRPMRLIEVMDTLTPFCGWGVDAQVLQDYQRTKAFLSRGPLARFAPGPLSYIVSNVTQTLPSYLFRGVPFVRVRNTGGDAFRMGAGRKRAGSAIGSGEVIFEGKARLICCSTIPYYGFGFRMFPFAEDRPDKMHLRLSVIDAVTFAANFPAIWRGEYENLENTFDFLVDRVEIETDPPTPFQIGGDAVGPQGKLTLALSKKPIDLVDYYAPPRGAGAS